MHFSYFFICFFCSTTQRQFSAGNPAAMVILEELEAAVQRGLRSKRLQQAPHLVGEAQKNFHFLLFEEKFRLVDFRLLVEVWGWYFLNGRTFVYRGGIGDHVC